MNVVYLSPGPTSLEYMLHINLQNFKRKNSCIIKIIYNNNDIDTFMYNHPRLRVVNKFVFMFGCAQLIYKGYHMSDDLISVISRLTWWYHKRVSKAKESLDDISSSRVIKLISKLYPYDELFII